MEDDGDEYGISGEQCGNDTERQYDHEETDSQEFQEQYRAARIAEELTYPLHSKTYEDKRRFFPANMPYRVYEKMNAMLT